MCDSAASSPQALNILVIFLTIRQNNLKFLAEERGFSLRSFTLHITDLCDVPKYNGGRIELMNFRLAVMFNLFDCISYILLFIVM